MVEALYTLLGTVIGFLLSEWAQSRREGREETRHSAAVANVISTEIAINQDFLARYKASALKAPQDEPQGDPPSLANHRAARAMLEIPLPSFPTQAYDSLLPDLGNALKPDELTACFVFYDGLSKLQAIRGAIAAALRDQREEWNLASGGSGSVPIGRAFGMARKFDRDAPTL